MSTMASAEGLWSKHDAEAYMVLQTAVCDTVGRMAAFSARRTRSALIEVMILHEKNRSLIEKSGVSQQTDKMEKLKAHQ